MVKCMSTDSFYTEYIVSTFIKDYESWGIKCFGDWLTYFDENFEQTLTIVNDYCLKVQTDRFEEIEQWKKTVMLNALALYMLEMDVYEVPTGDLRNQILKVFVETIRMYKFKKKGLINIIGQIYISNATNHQYSLI